METITRTDDRFEIRLDDEVVGFTRYVDADGARIYFHTVVEPAHEGKGLAGRLVKQALTETREEGLRVVPVCPYVNAYVRKHAEFEDVVDWPTDDHLQVLRERVGR